MGYKESKSFGRCKMTDRTGFDIDLNGEKPVIVCWNDDGTIRHESTWTTMRALRDWLTENVPA